MYWGWGHMYGGGAHVLGVGHMYCTCTHVLGEGHMGMGAHVLGGWAHVLGVGAHVLGDGGTCTGPCTGGGGGEVTCTTCIQKCAD